MTEGVRVSPGRKPVVLPPIWKKRAEALEIFLWPMKVREAPRRDL